MMIAIAETLGSPVWRVGRNFSSPILPRSNHPLNLKHGAEGVLRIVIIFLGLNQNEYTLCAVHMSARRSFVAPSKKRLR